MKIYTNTKETIKGAILLLFFMVPLLTFGQNDSTEIEKLRTESGVDPTRINSRIGFTAGYYKNDAGRVQVVNRGSLTLGVNRWSFSLKPEYASVYNGIPGSGFKSGMGDWKFSILNAFYVKNKVAVAAVAEFAFPFAPQGLGVPYFTVSPSLAFSYTLSQTLFLAVQPQYTYSLAKDPIYPDLNVLTTRMFAAKFFKTGLFCVLETRPIVDFENDKFDFVLSPIIGKSIGGGFNLIGLCELPVIKSANSSVNQVFQIGFNKNL